MGEKGAEKGVTAEKKSDGFNTVALTMGMHCEGCSKKIKRFLRKIEGVKEVKIEGSSKVSISGSMDVAKVVKMLAEKMKRKVELISPPHQNKKKEATDESQKKTVDENKKKKNNNKEEAPDESSKKPEDAEKKKPKKIDEKKQEENKPKQVSASTVILKIKLHCEGCMHRIKKSISNFKGVQEVNLDADKDQVSVRGTMDVKEMVPFLANKFRRAVDLVQPKQSNGGEKKVKQGEPDGGDGGGDGGGEGGKKGKGVVVETKEEVSKMEYHGNPQGFGHVYGQGYWMGYPSQQAGPSYGYTAQEQYNYYNYNPGYLSQAQHVHAPQMFSDENPNACSVM